MYFIVDIVKGLEYLKLNYLCDPMPNIKEKNKIFFKMEIICISMYFDPNQQDGPASSEQW